MKLFKLSILSLSVLLTGAMLFTACQPDDTDTIPTTLTETLQEDTDLSTFVKAIESAGLTSFLDAATGITVFAPNNAAFDTYLYNSGYNDVDNIPLGELNNLVLNHVLDSYYDFADLTTGYIKTLAKSQPEEYLIDMKIDVEENRLNNSASIISSDNNGLTGVFHIVDAVITVPDVMDFVIGDGNLDSMRDALSFVELTNPLQQEGPFTIFAPIDEALEWSTSVNLEDMEFWYEALSDHIVDGNLREEDFVNNMLIENTWGADATSSYRILTETFDGTIQIVEADDDTSIITRINTTNIQARNGVVHLINKIIVL